ncbi:MAG: biotin/lipoyl-containing protein [Bacteroidales bacterium]|jgi:biotin carboxyl carrier protein
MKSFKFTILGNQYDVDVKSIDDNLAQVEVNGTNYEVEIHRQKTVTKTPILVRNPAKAPEPAHMSAGTRFLAVRTPLPGNILNIQKKNGDLVIKGDVVLIYEAMKMENKILAEKDGTIRNMKVNQGDNILQDDILFEIE